LGTHRIKTQQHTDELRALRRQGPLGVDDLDLLALKHRDVGELALRVGAPVLDHEQARLDHFDHEAERRDRARSTPHRQIPAIFPDAEVNAGAFDGRGELREVRGVERHRPFHEQGGAGGLGRQIRQRNGRLAAFFAPQARPEGGVDDALYRGGVGRGHLTGNARPLHVAPKVLRHGFGDGVSRRVRDALHGLKLLNV